MVTAVARYVALCSKPAPRRDAVCGFDAGCAGTRTANTIDDWYDRQCIAGDCVIPGLCVAFKLLAHSRTSCGSDVHASSAAIPCDLSLGIGDFIPRIG